MVCECKSKKEIFPRAIQQTSPHPMILIDKIITSGPSIAMDLAKWMMRKWCVSYILYRIYAIVPKKIL